MQFTRSPLALAEEACVSGFALTRRVDVKGDSIYPSRNFRWDIHITGARNFGRRSSTGGNSLLFPSISLRFHLSSDRSVCPLPYLPLLCPSLSLVLIRPRTKYLPVVQKTGHEREVPRADAAGTPGVRAGGPAVGGDGHPAAVLNHRLLQGRQAEEGTVMTMVGDVDDVDPL